MATNPYFNTLGYKNEQNLAEDLVIEVIKIHGMDVHYLPRTIVNKHFAFGEDPISRFMSQKPIEMYLENVNGFEGDQDLITKFGFEVRDNATFIVSKKRFQKETEMVRPLEGDLIYFPMTKGLFEIKYVEHETPFYQFGKNYVFKLKTELFQFSEETIETGEDEIDEIPAIFDYNVTLTVTGGTGTFVVGELVYQYLNGSITGAFTGADNTATVEAISGNTVKLKDSIGTWAQSDTTNVYVTSQDHTRYKIVSGMDDNINDVNMYNDNDQLEDQGDDLLDTDTNNPFGEP